MKKTLFMLALMTAGTFAAKAQIQKGNVLFGADISDISVAFKPISSFTFEVHPKAAWFVKDNTAIGGYVDLMFNTIKGAGTKFDYGIGALARQYTNGNAVPALRHTRLFVEGNVGIEGKNSSPSTGSSTTTNGLGIGIGPGLAYFVTPNIGLEGLLKYDGSLGFGSATTTSGLKFNFGLQIYLPSRTIRNAAMNKQ